MAGDLGGWVLLLDSGLLCVLSSLATLHVLLLGSWPEDCVQSTFGQLVLDGTQAPSEIASQLSTSNLLQISPQLTLRARLRSVDRECT